MLATNTLPLYLNNTISKHFLKPFACAWCQIKEWAVNKGFPVVLWLSHNKTKTIYTISTANVQDQIPSLENVPSCSYISFGCFPASSFSIRSTFVVHRDTCLSIIFLATAQCPTTNASTTSVMRRPERQINATINSLFNTQCLILSWHRFRVGIL